MVKFKHGIVVAAHPLAAKAGVSMLKRGGNAVDAASATALALGAVTPAFCGIGGGGFALIWLANEGKAVFIDYRERAPSAAREDMFRLTAKGEVVRKENSVGHRAVAVPGTVAGHSLMVEKFGRLRMKDVLRPAIKHASEGFQVSKALAEVWKWSVSKFRPFKGSRLVYLKRGKPYREGDRIKLKDLARSFKSLAKNGQSDFYTGRLGERIVEDVSLNGGLFTGEDLERYRPTVGEPLRGTYRDWEVITAPPPSSGGIIILQTLNMLENYNLREFGHNSTPALHLISEALMRAYANTRSRVCDPDFARVPVNALISKDFANTLTASINPNAASGLVQVSEIPQSANSSTSHLSVADSEGNVVALTESVECYFGSGIVVPRTGILLNDTMHDFDPKPGQLNSVGPRKIPMSSMSPTIVLKDGRPMLALGSAGSTRIVSSTFQVMFSILEFGMSVKEAVEAPRIHPENNLVRAERRVSADSIKELRRMGHKVEVRKPSEMYFGGVHVASVGQQRGEFEGGADPRRGGVAFGY